LDCKKKYVTFVTKANKKMSSESNFRRAIVQADFNKKSFPILFIDCLVLIAVIWWFYGLDAGFIVGMISFVALFFGLTAILVALAATCIYVSLTYLFFNWLGFGFLTYLICLLVLGLSVVLHAGSEQYIDDLS
jgi:hypothetical protein